MNSQKKKKKTHVPVRLNILFFVVFLLFSILVLRLGVLQIIYGENYSRELERTEDVTVNNPVPRGKILDRTLKTVVDNNPVDAITYTRYQGTTTEEMLDTAKKLATFIQMDTKKITERDKKDFWILMNPDEAEELITDTDRKKVEAEEIEEGDLYKLQLERITEKQLDSFSNEELQVLAVYRELASAKSLTPYIIKNENVTPQEVAIVSENLESLPGVEVTTDWNRKYLYDKTLQSVIGKVSSSEEGLPMERLDYYLSRDYNRDDRVGKSYFEYQYEDLLQGQKAKVKNITNKSGEVIESVPITDGKRGSDLVLTIDMDLQLAVEKIIEEELREKKAYGNTALLDRAFVVLMDPNTGEILTMAGKQYDKDKEGNVIFNDFALGNFTTSYNMGSAVKGATVLAGLQSGAITPSTGFMDTKMYIKGTPPKGSYQNLGYMNIENALKRSSNVYMFRTAIEMGGGVYRPYESLSVDPAAYDTMRYYFSQMGLGVRTGIDLPNEMTGFKGTEKNAGKLMDLSIGQYDTYTPLQLAQYVSTIANGGNRLQPHLLKEVREPSDDPEELGGIVKEVSPTVMNRLDMEQSWIKLVQSGFRKVMQEQGGTAYSKFASASYSPAGKTGTAQAFYDGPKKDNFDKVMETWNITLAAYAPSDNPEVAMSVVVPWAYQTNSGHSMNLDIGRKVLDKYFELKESRAKGIPAVDEEPAEKAEQNEDEENIED
ncbi:penicillin-binding protein 2 [Bacillus sp. AGMB 02131]|uniref:serine-type D-Ala-D-Ala carboxypeptidase n=1 Tax=Peribacillus faecalis TaxID=2772559 RepID=A0A927CTN0_9BACI|nr:penicillin-binding protein 2 [Peribacillus faecalis]MBD3107643.1 penicillin-binding protein 2 [Peribacillus faecalis]